MSGETYYFINLHMNLLTNFAEDLQAQDSMAGKCDFLLTYFPVKPYIKGFYYVMS